MTAVGFEATQLALVELEPTPLDHSGKLSWKPWGFPYYYCTYSDRCPTLQLLFPRQVNPMTGAVQKYSRRDLNSQSPPYEGGALSIRPHEQLLFSFQSASYLVFLPISTPSPRILELSLQFELRVLRP